MITLNDFSKKALRRVSPIYENSDFVQHFFNSVGVDYEFIRKYFRTFREQFFIDTVTWGIALQEIKYSLDVRPDLTLAQRRQRLGIKAQIHRPLNPARLEKAILDYFGVRCFLYEKDPGFIRIFFNHISDVGYDGMMNFLFEEKPAHLMLSTSEHIIEYIGGEENRNAQKVIGPDDEPLLPETPKDKQNFPRIFAGVAQGIGGAVKIDLPQLENQIMRPSAGMFQVAVGEVKIGGARPKSEKILMHAGVSINIGGEIFIKAADEPLPPLVVHENATTKLAVARFALARGAMAFIAPPEPDLENLQGDLVKIFFDFPISRHRRVRGISMKNARENLTREEIKEVGQFAVENELILNEWGEKASGVSHAALKIRNEYKLF